MKTQFIYLLRLVLLLSAPLLQATGALAQEDLSKVVIGTEQVRDGLYMLTGSGGNIGVLVGTDGVLVIDDQYAPLSARILAAIGKLSDRPVRFVLNTHWHSDHAGGNENFQAAGAIIVAHRNVRTRLAAGQFISFLDARIDAAPASALPVITFSDAMNFYWNGQDLHISHVPAAHTDGDSIVHFPGLNAFHMGDTYFSGMYPFIDKDSGGSVAGVIAALDRVLADSDPATRIIPGHGPVSDRAALQAYRTMLATVSARIESELANGASREAIIAGRPSAEFDERYGGGFIEAPRWAGMLVDLLTAPSAN